jgi:glycosyltransferase involved in cell wall biosynthesis
MKVLIAGQTFYRKDNGQAVFTINLAEGLACAGHHVLVLVPSENGRAGCTQNGKLTIQTTASLPLGYRINATFFIDKLVRRTVARFAPDVVHIQDHYFLSRSVVRAARRYGVKTVGTNHFLPENLTDNIRLPTALNALVNRWLWRMMLDLYNRLDAVTAPTQTAVNILKAQQLAPPVAAASCGIDPARFRPRPKIDRIAIRRKYGVALDRTVLLYVGRIDREKCLDLMVRAMAQLDRHDVQFVIAGKGKYCRELEQLCQRQRLGDRVVFCGFVPEADLPLLHNSVDAFVMPGHAELQSIATLEAMSSGLPILAANARALPELVEPGVNGYLFAPHDVEDVVRQLTALLSNREQWAMMGLASQEKAKVHAHWRTVERYADWYAQTSPRATSAVSIRPSYQIR